MTTQARELPPLYMVIDSDDTEYKYATYEDALEAYDLLLEVYNDSMATALAEAEELDIDEDDTGGIASSPEPYVMKWSADAGEWEVLDW